MKYFPFCSMTFCQLSVFIREKLNMALIYLKVTLFHTRSFEGSESSERLTVQGPTNMLIQPPIIFDGPSKICMIWDTTPLRVMSSGFFWMVDLVQIIKFCLWSCLRRTSGTKTVCVPYYFIKPTFLSASYHSF